MADAHCRAFLPSKDFDLSKRFYEALGFAKMVEGDVAVFNAGSGGFILTRHRMEELDGELMMGLMVDDLDAWWSQIQSLDLAKTFGVPAPRPPAVQPWGLRIVYVIDPCRVLWHIAERRPGQPQDA